jgi:hypothetical protein
MFTIGMLLVFFGIMTMKLFGMPFKQLHKAADYIGGVMVLLGMCLLVISIAVLAWRLLP